MDLNPPPSVFIDSSAWISYVIPTDTNYHKAVSIFQSFLPTTKIYTSLFILDEVMTKIRRVLSQKEADTFYRYLSRLENKKVISILPVTKKTVNSAIKLLNDYPTPNTFSLTNATNVILIEKKKIAALFTFDSDFRKLKRSNLIIIP